MVIVIVLHISQVESMEKSKQFDSGGARLPPSILTRQVRGKVLLPQDKDSKLLDGVHFSPFRSSAPSLRFAVTAARIQVRARSKNRFRCSTVVALLAHARHSPV
jgi:hypothetical protein